MINDGVKYQLLEKRAKIARSVQSHKRIPLSSFVSTDLHVVVTDTGNLVAAWETEGLDSSCLSEDEIKAHHKWATLAINESDPRLMFHQYYVKDRAAYAAKDSHYREEVINAIDKAREATLKGKEFYGTRIVYALEWKIESAASSQRLDKVSRLIWDAIGSIYSAKARASLKARVAALTGEKVARKVTERRLLLEIEEFQRYADGFFSKMEKIQLSSSINPSVTEGIGPAKMTFQKLCGKDAFNFYSRLWNWDKNARSYAFLPSINYLAHFIGKSEVDFGRHGYILSGRTPVRLFTLKFLQRDTIQYDLLRHVRNISANMVIHTRFAQMSIDRSSRLLQGRITKAHNFGGFSKGDPEKELRIEELKEAKAESVRGKPFGEYSCTIAISADTLQDLDEKVRILERICQGEGMVLREEEMSKDYAFYSLMPGNYLYEFVVLNGQTSMATALMMPYRMPEGWGEKPPRGSMFPEPLCNLNGYSLETKTMGPVNFWLNVQDLGHFGVVGGSGAGKSFNVGYLMTNMGRYLGTDERPMHLKRWIVDKGGSYKSLCTLLGGAYIDVGSREATGVSPMNPFDLPPNELRMQAGKLAQFVQTLMAAGSSMGDFSIQEHETRAIESAIQNMAADCEKTNRHGSLPFLAKVHFPAVGASGQIARLSTWLPDGPCGHLFPDQRDGFGSSDFVVFNFDEDKVPEVAVGPVFQYILMQIENTVESSKYAAYKKLLFIDEAPYFLSPKSEQDERSVQICERLRSFIRTGWVTWRKRGGIIGIAAQEPAQLWRYDDFWDTFRSAVPTKFYLKQEYSAPLVEPKRGLGIPEHLAERLITLDKGVFLVDQRGMRRFLKLEVDPTSYAIYSTDPDESMVRDKWLAANRVTPERGIFEIFEDLGKIFEKANKSDNRIEYLHSVKYTN